MCAILWTCFPGISESSGLVCSIARGRRSSLRVDDKDDRNGQDITNLVYVDIPLVVVLQVVYKVLPDILSMSLMAFAERLTKATPSFSGSFCSFLTGLARRLRLDPVGMSDIAKQSITLILMICDNGCA